MKKVISFGELLVDFIPTENGLGLERTSFFQKMPGGAPANVAAAVAKLGGTSYFIGKVGEDAFGRFASECLSNAHVCVDHILFTKEAQTAVAFVSLTKEGERDFLFYGAPAAHMLFAPEEVQRAWFNEETVFHFGSNSLAYEESRQATVRAIELAKEKGALVSFDPNIRLSFWEAEEEARSMIVSLLSAADIIKVSEEELGFLFPGLYEAEAIRRLIHTGSSLVIITRGKRGSSYYTSIYSGEVSAPHMQVIDTTGAGDAFVGGLLYQLSSQSFSQLLKNEQAMKRVVEFSNACGALAVTARGAMTALPTLEEVHLVLKR
ncbi:PfkB family carbohydrate kinase [Bacillus thermotolerans]|uniref:PfkB family carbohydrate kinase n=1 Tax=Bacillus thermotolerans TaxID=1221996 RepID=UPI0005895858|nr:PfkB family carbohydrate kinase [Bacillus thermotolerans]KKB43783.1 Fructokinase [Bacillus thermotolerans]